MFSFQTQEGFYGNFGGAYIPELLHKNIEELQEKYLQIMREPDFQKEFNELLKDYVGRPTPLYFAKRLSAHYKTNIYLKIKNLNNKNNKFHNCFMGNI